MLDRGHLTVIFTSDVELEQLTAGVDVEQRRLGAAAAWEERRIAGKVTIVFDRHK